MVPRAGMEIMQVFSNLSSHSKAPTTESRICKEQRLTLNPLCGTITQMDQLVTSQLPDGTLIK